jgi:hypothetical protein
MAISDGLGIAALGHYSSIFERMEIIGTKKSSPRCLAPVSTGRVIEPGWWRPANRSCRARFFGRRVGTKIKQEHPGDNAVAGAMSIGVRSVADDKTKADKQKSRAPG